MKLTVKSNFYNDSKDSRFSNRVIRFSARFKYLRDFSRYKFSIFEILLFYKSRI